MITQSVYSNNMPEVVPKIDHRRRLVLASGSATRSALLINAGLTVEVMPARIDEHAIRSSLVAESASPRDISDALAEYKAVRIVHRAGDALVIGCDQILELDGAIVAKPESIKQAASQLRSLRGRSHRLYSAVVVLDHGVPVWRYTATSELTMRSFSDTYLDEYLFRNAGVIAHSPGGYQIEAEGIRLFNRIEGDYFAILGLPMLPLLNWLGESGAIAT